MIRWQDVNGIYQIYPRSFKDTNNDGIGDLKGIVEKLDYIKSTLGIDAIWISPFFLSPMADFGYDVADYRKIDPMFGTMQNFKALLDEAHKRHIKVMIDYVPNHTSNEHKWFQESRSSKHNPKRDWYVWRDPKEDGSVPNNWLSVFGGSAWELDEITGQYYLHSFLKEQPDLNWDNPKVRKEMTNVLRFWLDLGVDGIRADAIRWISKDIEFRDNILDPLYDRSDDPYHSQIQAFSRSGPQLVTYLKEMAAVIEEYPDRIILFEDYIDKHFDRTEQYTRLYSVNPAVAAPFNFEGMRLEYDAGEFRDFINHFEKFSAGKLRSFYCFSNHDKPRLASKVGVEQAKLIALLQLTLPGIPVVYYGDELGMTNGEISSNQVRDPFELQNPGHGFGRDPERTPMQWSNELFAGFSAVTPWLPIAKSASTLTVENEKDDPLSFLSFYRHLLKLRRLPVFRSGEYVEWISDDPNVFGFTRQNPTDKLHIILNMSGHKSDVIRDIKGEIMYSTHDTELLVSAAGMTLLPHQGIIVRCAS
jgi:alpha-glucosidase